MINKKKLHLGIIGAGMWGTAFASLAADNGCQVSIWDRNNDIIKSINETHINIKYFPNKILRKNILGISNLDELLKSDIIVIALPFQNIKEFISTNVIFDFCKHPILLLSKGIEIASHELGSQIIARVLPNSTYAILSGPNFAHEIIAGLPAAAMVASVDEAILDIIKQSISSPVMRIYTSSDVKGVEICGAIKNVIAIAAGICAGAEYGENAKAALIARSINEIESLVKALNGKATTVNSVAGIGDLILTCNSINSRNFELGLQIGRQGSVGDLLKANSKTVEGVHTAKAAQSLAKQLKIDLPISEEIYSILYENKKVHASLKSLMLRQ